MPLLGHLPPLWKAPRHIVFPNNCGVDGRPYADTVQGLNLFAQQIAPADRRVADAGARRIVAHAVVALGKDSHAVDIGPLHGAGEFGCIKLGSDVWNVGRRMKIQMHLSLVLAEYGVVHHFAITTLSEKPVAISFLRFLF